MKLSELLLAVHIRNLAVELLSVARADYFSGIFGLHDENQRRLNLTRWDRDHPIEMFVPLALEQIEQVASLVAELLAGDDA